MLVDILMHLVYVLMGNLTLSQGDDNGRYEAGTVAEYSSSNR